MAPFLNLIYSDERSKEAFACLSAFRPRWGIACYGWEYGVEPALILFDAKLTPIPWK